MKITDLHTDDFIFPVISLDILLSELNEVDNRINYYLSEEHKSKEYKSIYLNGNFYQCEDITGKDYSNYTKSKLNESYILLNNIKDCINLFKFVLN
jgi:hypothetical protein